MLVSYCITSYKCCLTEVCKTSHALNYSSFYTNIHYYSLVNQGERRLLKTSYGVVSTYPSSNHRTIIAWNERHSSFYTIIYSFADIPKNGSRHTQPIFRLEEKEREKKKRTRRFSPHGNYHYNRCISRYRLVKENIKIFFPVICSVTRKNH